MAKKIFGLSSIKYADVAVDGGMGSDFNTSPETVVGTATITQEDPTITDFNIEESDSPVESIQTQAGKVTFAWSSYNIGYLMLKKLFGGTGNLAQAVGSVNVLGTLTGGSSYTNGYYEDVALSVNTGSGSGARANIKVSGGAVTEVEFTALGSGYTGTNELSCAAGLIGGTGSGWKVVVSSVHASAVGETWEAPDTFPDVEKSLQLTDKKGNVVKIPRAKIVGKLGISFTKDALGQVDFTATVLQPSKSGEKRLTIVKAS